ncbi:UNVERIFIED_CONTAM: hypothetical protein Sangu_2451100 [Sesamum angustifolium]|uniref:Uncharacterized protein n=1 Tax=Sesamum angustifolium TaxID=2727405 RepID=A0AAW2KWV0_9LAMI
MIAGGPTNRDSGRARRAHSRAAKIVMDIDDKEPTEGPMIHFGPTDAQGVHLPHNDILVISITVASYTIQLIFVDSGSSTDVLFYKAYQQIELVDTSLCGFVGEVVQSLGQISLPLSSGTESIRRTRMVSFLVVDMPSTYNLISGQSTLNTF